VDALVQHILRQLRQVDILICSAGIYPRGPAISLPIERYHEALAVNFYGSLLPIYALLPHMLERKTGHIVVISSVDGKKGLPLDAAYVSSKFAITGFLDVLRQELRGTGVHVSTVLPGRVDTPMIAGITVPQVSAPIRPERVAYAVVRAIERRKREVYVPYWSSKTIVVLSTLLPGLGDALVRMFRLEGTPKNS
jgi:short-subunit dehydrogenase